jgi:outer membrane cobalamin receptor
LVLEANGFWSSVDDKIVQTTNGNQAVAMNVASAEVLGMELGAELSYRQNVRLVGAATFSDSESYPAEGVLVEARQLTRLPKARAYARLEGSAFFSGVLHRATVFVTGDYVSTFFYAVSNDVPRPQLSKLGFGAALGFLNDRIELQARVADLLDARGQDFQRLPLPGRFVGFLLSIKEES